uniref:hypothetical protein n=1 Tax=Nitzschia traheaformis TaxID=1881117 RepID=UPI001EF9E054|nr:hypothetical protein MKU15_pgp051 [Nitzschia traheaformis]ULD15904.1 hypothetical protein [Nitzschia traheaformis]
MKTEEIYKYPYNARKKDEIKVFLSDQIGDQVVKITYINGKFFCTLKNRITHKKKEIVISAVFILAGLLGVPEKARSIGVPIRLPSSPEMNRPAPQYFYQHGPTVSPKLDKITFIKYREVPMCIYMMDERFLKTSGTRKLINKIRGGSLIESAAALVVIVVIWQIMGVGIEGFVPNNQNPGWGVDQICFSHRVVILDILQFMIYSFREEQLIPDQLYKLIGLPQCHMRSLLG